MISGFSGSRFYSSGSGYTISLINSQSEIGVQGWHDRIRCHVLKEMVYSGGAWNSGNLYKNRIDAVEFLCMVMGIDISDGYISGKGSQWISGGQSGYYDSYMPHPASSGSYLSGVQLNEIICNDQSDKQFYITLDYAQPVRQLPADTTLNDVIVEGAISTYQITGTCYIDNSGHWMPAVIPYQTSGSHGLISGVQLCTVTNTLKLLTKSYKRLTTVNPTLEAASLIDRVNASGMTSGAITFNSGCWHCDDYHWTLTKAGIYDVQAKFTYRPEGWQDLIWPEIPDPTTGKSMLIPYPSGYTIPFGTIMPSGYDTLPRSGSGYVPYYNRILSNKQTFVFPSWINIFI